MAMSKVSAYVVELAEETPVCRFSAKPMLKSVFLKKLPELREVGVPELVLKEAADNLRNYRNRNITAILCYMPEDRNGFVLWADKFLRSFDDVKHMIGTAAFLRADFDEPNDLPGTLYGSIGTPPWSRS